MILKCCSQLNGDRTIQAVYHLFTGKRSIQTVQDAHLYRLERLYGIYPSLTLKDFNEVINRLSRQNYMIHGKHKNVFILSEKGERWLANNKSITSTSAFDGLKYHPIDFIFFERLLLLIQVLTNRHMNNSAYIPIIDKSSITSWVKNIYKEINHHVYTYLKIAYQELHQLLSDLTEQEADLFVSRLTGYNNFGMSIQQLAHTYQKSNHDIQLILIKIIHQMLNHIYSQPKSFRLMNLIVDDLSTNGFITQSAYQTYQLIQKNYSIQKIAQMRHLKQNTIYDHIVEIALYDQDFPINEYVSDQEQKEIINVVRQTNSTKLRVIKNHVDEKFSYFQIRLALASMTRATKQVF